jgi:putative membrane protein
VRVIALLGLFLLAASGLARAQDAGVQQHLTDNDRQFLAYVNEGSQAEAQMCQYAAENTQSPAVRAFARLMLFDQKDLADRLAALIQREGIQLPPRMGQQTMAKIAPKSGVNFDSEFIGAQVEHHTNDLQRFEAVQSKTQDEGLRQFVSQTVPVLQQHIALARAVAQSLGQQTTGRGGAR